MSTEPNPQAASVDPIVMPRPSCNCGCSTGIHEDDIATGEPDAPWGLTYGSGQLDEWGYWSKPCRDCARWAEKRDGVPMNSYWPFN